MGLATHYFGCLESSYNPEKTRACATNQLTGLYISQGIQKRAKQNLRKTAFRKIQSDRVCLDRPYHFKFFKGCLPQILLGPFWYNMTHMTMILVLKGLSLLIMSRCR